MSRANLTGLSAVRHRLAVLTEGLERAASGEVLKRAVAAVQHQVDAVAKSKLDGHSLSGTAASTLSVTASGSLVTCTSQAYLKYHGWWPFKDARMPPFVITRAVRIYQAELTAVLEGKASPLGLADAASAAKEEARAAKSRAKFKAATAKIARRQFAQSDAGKAARKAASAQRRSDRQIDRATKAREDSE